MNGVTVIGLFLGPVAIIDVILTRRFARSARQGDEEWRRRWRELDPARKQSIRRKMKRGEAVPDPEDAELARRAVAQVDYIRKAMAPLVIINMVVVLAFLAVGIASGLTFLIVVAAAGLGSTAVLDVLSRHQRRQHRQSVAATERLHALGGGNER